MPLAKRRGKFHKIGFTKKSSKEFLGAADDESVQRDREIAG